jgi:hypothetical protein
VELTTQERLAGALTQLRADERETLATALESWVAAAHLANEAPSMFLEEKKGGAEGTKGARKSTTSAPQGTAHA